MKLSIGLPWAFDSAVSCLLACNHRSQRPSLGGSLPGAARVCHHRQATPAWPGAEGRRRLAPTAASSSPAPDNGGDEAAATFHASALPRLRKTARLEPSFALSQEDAVVAQLRALQAWITQHACCIQPLSCMRCLGMQPMASCKRGCSSKSSWWQTEWRLVAAPITRRLPPSLTPRSTTTSRPLMPA